MRRILLLLALVAPASADAAVLRGETSQGRPVAVRLGADGHVRSVAIRFRAECDRGFLRDRIVMRAPFDEASKTAVSDERSVTADDDNDPYRITTEMSLDAQRESARRWTGTYDASSKVTQDGRVVSRCVLTPVTFEVARATAD